MKILLAPFKFIGTTGSLTFLAICVGLGILVWWWRPRWRRAAVVWIGSVTAIHVMLSLPVVALTIVAWLPPGVPAGSGPVTALDRLVVLDGDNRRGRLQVAIDTNAAASPREIWILGEWWLFENLIHAGVPRPRLIHDEASPTTREQVQQIANLIRARPGRTALIASRLQMPRVAALVRAAAIDVTLIPSPIDDEPAARGVKHFLPSYYAFRTSRDAIYELFAVAYYRREGWMK